MTLATLSINLNEQRLHKIMKYGLYSVKKKDNITEVIGKKG